MDHLIDDADRLPELPPEGHPLRALGQRLVELLDEDQWAECEALLLKAYADAERYRFLRRKFAIVGGGDGAEFRALNLPRPTYIAPDPAAELDAAIDAAVCRRCGHENDAHDK